MSAHQLDAPELSQRLKALEDLRAKELRGETVALIGPALPSYDHVHSHASYGLAPGVFSVAHMVWAAHEAKAYSILSVEHESLAHMDEAIQAVKIVNRGAANPLRLALAVEFKAPIAINDDKSRAFSDAILRAWGQGEAAWVVAVGVKPSAELTALVTQFQEAKRIRSEAQLAKLNHHLGITPPLTLGSMLTPEGNITDRGLCTAVAQAKWPDADDAAIGRHASAVRKLLNPGGPAYAPWPAGLPSYQELTRKLADMGAVPTFTAQLRKQILDDFLPLITSWGIGGVDVAGIEPTESDAAEQIECFARAAARHGLAFFGGSDYRGVGTGWQQHAAWMDNPMIHQSLDRVCRQD